MALISVRPATVVAVPVAAPGLLFVVLRALKIVGRTFLTFWSAQGTAATFPTRH